MADGPVEPGGRGDYPSDMEARVAVLEQIAKSTQATLDRIERRMDALETGLRAEIREIRAEMREIRAELQSDFRWLLGIMLGGMAGLLGGMAHGFHWL